MSIWRVCSNRICECAAQVWSAEIGRSGLRRPPETSTGSISPWRRSGCWWRLYCRTCFCSSWPSFSPLRSTLSARPAMIIPVMLAWKYLHGCYSFCLSSSVPLSVVFLCICLHCLCRLSFLSIFFLPLCLSLSLFLSLINRFFKYHTNSSYILWNSKEENWLWLVGYADNRHLRSRVRHQQDRG